MEQLDYVMTAFFITEVRQRRRHDRSPSLWTTSLFAVADVHEGHGALLTALLTALLQMCIKVTVLGFAGHEGSYLRDGWCVQKEKASGGCPPPSTPSAGRTAMTDGSPAAL